MDGSVVYNVGITQHYVTLCGSRCDWHTGNSSFRHLSASGNAVPLTIGSISQSMVSTRVAVVVVVAQPNMYAYACAHASSVTELKSHRSLPKHLPLHTEESLEKVHPVTNFTNQSLAASLVK